MTAHTCHAYGCDKVVPRKMLMCLRHWRMVPRDLQRNVWRHYQRGQETRMDPSREYLAAATTAMEAVAKKEAKG